MHRSARGVDVPGADTYPLQLQLLLSCAFFILAHFQGERNGERTVMMRDRTAPVRRTASGICSPSRGYAVPSHAAASNSSHLLA